MKFNSQICTTKIQSERLLALGLKKETADMILFKSPNLPQYPFDYTFNHDTSILADVRYVPMVKGETPFIQDGNIPAWSLHRLIEMMPCGFQDENYRNFVLKVDSQDISYVYNYVDDEGYGQSDSIDVDDIYHNLYDGIIAHIKWLIKEGLFNKEYLEEWLWGN